jgi:hypothetical protein
VGEYGAWVKHELDRFTDVEYLYYTGHYYDRLLAVALTISNALVQGKEFETWAAFRARFTDLRFTGSSGMVQMTKDSNDRHHGNLEIANLQQDSDGTFKVRTVGIYNRFADTVWKFYSPGIIYPDGTTVPPIAVISNDSDCPFNSSDSDQFDRGVLLSFVF